MTQGRGLAAARLAVGGQGEFQQVRSEPKEKGADLAWDGGQRDPTVPCSSQPPFVRFPFLPGRLLTPQVSPPTPLVQNQGWASWSDHTPRPPQPAQSLGLPGPQGPRDPPGPALLDGDVRQPSPEDLVRAVPPQPDGHQLTGARPRNCREGGRGLRQPGGPREEKGRARPPLQPREAPLLASSSPFPRGRLPTRTGQDKGAPGTPRRAQRHKPLPGAAAARAGGQWGVFSIPP